MSYTVPSLTNNRTATLPSNSQTNNESSSGNSKITAIQPTTKTDVLTLSQTAKSLNSNEQLLSAKPEIDLEKVASIKHALANGTYPLDAEKVAAKFIEIEGLLGKL
ncbi:MAG: flagellar biosynthesis anti-sigma factor FlgM [Gammaproteobacteria bacterium]|nr:flagellar biosynthesis anti-sigma factor FlgM [Gammaproteobacteria bacterium]